MRHNPYGKGQQKNRQLTRARIERCDGNDAAAAAVAATAAVVIVFVLK